MQTGDEFDPRPVRRTALPRPDDNSPFATRRNPPTDGAQELSELLGTLALASSDRAHHGAQSAAYLRRRRQFANHLVWLLGFGERVELQVEPREIRFGGAVVYRGRRPDETFSQRLYADGVRWIAFEPGVDHRAAELLVDHLCPYVSFDGAPDAHIARSAPVDRMPGVGFEVRTERRFGQVPFGASEVEVVTHTLLSYTLELPDPPELPGGTPDLAFDGRVGPLPRSVVEGASLDLWSALLDDFASEPDPVPGLARLGRAIQELLHDPDHTVPPDEVAARVDRLVGELLERGQPENAVRLVGALFRDDASAAPDEPTVQALDRLLAGLATVERLQALQQACSGIDLDAPVFDHYLELLPPQGLATLLDLPFEQDRRSWSGLRTRAMQVLHAKLEAGVLARYPVWERIHTLRAFGRLAGPPAAAWIIERIPANWKEAMEQAAPWILGLGATGDPRAVPYLAMISGRAQGRLQEMAREDLFRIRDAVQGDGGAR